MSEVSPEVTPSAEPSPEVSTGTNPEVGGELESAPDVETPEWQKMKHKLKVDGEELEVDWSELTKGYQRATSAQKRFIEAQKARQEVEADKTAIKNLFALADSNPEALMLELGIDPLKFSESRIMREIEREQMSPEQVEALDWEEKAKKAREEVETFEANKKQTQMEKLDGS
jgi:hypothetical protein